MENLFLRIFVDGFLVFILAAGVFIAWLWKGRPTSFWKESSKDKIVGNTRFIYIVLTVAIAVIFYINNR